MFNRVIEKIEVYNPKVNRKNILEAFDLISEDGVLDEKDLFHSVGAVECLLPLKPDDASVIATLLNLFYKKGFMSSVQVKKRFGGDVLGILNKLMGLEVLNYSVNDRAAQLEILRKMFLTMAKDIRVVLIRLSYRLFAMRNIEVFVKKGGFDSFALETFDVYVPLASRLGVYRMKVQLEDLSFRYMYPDDYEEVSNQLRRFGKSRDNAIKYIKVQLDRYFKKWGYELDVTGRVKSVFSIYTKMKRKGFTDINDLYDVFAMRVVVPYGMDGFKNGADGLYSVLGLIHTEWKPISRRFKDYVAVPKPNGYRSLHTVVVGLGPSRLEKPIEIQVRTARMHDEAEYGIASHWIYKRDDLNMKDGLKHQIDWLKGLEAVHKDLAVDSDILREIEVDVFKDSIFVLTPNGEIKNLPVGSVALDFAYFVHTDIGHRCVMAKVNGVAVPLSYELDNGDVVEIITRKDSGPKLQWLSIVKTGSAKTKIRFWFNKLDRENHIKEGKLLLNNGLKRMGKVGLDSKYSILKNYGGQRLTINQRESLIGEIGRGNKLPGDIIRKVIPADELIVSNEGKTYKKRRNLKSSSSLNKVPIEDLVLVGGESGLPIKMGSCCNPKIGDSISGYVTRGNRITIHSVECKILKNLNEKRVISAGWDPSEIDQYIGRSRVKLLVVGIPRIGLIRDISAVISGFDLDITGMHMNSDNKGHHHFHFVLDFYDVKILDSLMDKLEIVDGVESVMRED